VTVFETSRLTAAEVTEDDVSELLDVHLSNQAYLDLTEGSGGLAVEALRGLADHGRDHGWTRLREGVLEGNDGGMALARALGMREVERKPYRIAAGDRELAVMEQGPVARSQRAVR
jgi:hypothetical protein